MLLARLGNVLYWTGCTIAALAGAMGVFQFTRDDPAGVLFGVFFLGVAGVSWIVGWAFCYILRGD